MNLIIGSHVSYKKEDGLLGSVKEALSYGSNTFMFYTGAPQNTARNPIDKELTKQGLKLMEENGIDRKNIIVHAPYIINLANEKNMDFGISFLRQELKRVEELGFDKVVLHPGSHIGLGNEVGLKNIIYALNQVIDDNNKVMILLETMAGKGSECASSFEDIKTIIDSIKNNNMVGVCLDTCHLNDAGYDMSKFDKVLEEFDKIIGIDKIKCIHINDSKNILNSRKDRHENIGYGKLGFDNIINIIYNDKLKDVPKILETPYVGNTIDSKERLYPPFKFEIEMIKNKKFDSKLHDNIVKYYR